MDYLVVYQLGFLVRLFSCPAEDRRDVVSNAAEQEAGIRLMGLDEYPRDFAVSMVGQLVVQLRSYSVGARVDDWIWNHLPELREQQEQAVRTQLDEGGRARYWVAAMLNRTWGEVFSSRGVTEWLHECPAT